MKQQPKAFQNATVEAILSHYKKDHDRALCADEAGLGKTIVAAEVIRQMAEKQAETISIDSLITWWESFGCELKSIRITQKDKNTGSGQEYKKYIALQSFYKTIIGTECQNCRRKNGYYDNETWKTNVITGIEAKLNESNSTPGFIAKFLKALAQLYQDGRTSSIEGKRIMGNWQDFPMPTGLPEPYRVLYICNSLALAEQNTKKLVSVPQRSIRSSIDKPDRLSTLWYYLQYTTPFLEIYPITATVTKTSTLGTGQEWGTLEKQPIKDLFDQLSKMLKILNISVDDNTLKRSIGEALSLERFKPDLVIFDEFQKFTDIINLIDDTKFDEYINKLKEKNSVSNYDNDEEKDNSDRIEALKRCRKICQGLFNKDAEKMPKILMLSATPFHTLEDTGEKTKIDIESLVEFMGGDKNKYKNAVKDEGTEDVEKILYDDCGIFRTERFRLMNKEHHSYHIIRCSDEGIFARAMRIKPREKQNDDDVKGNRTFGISMNVTDLSAVGKCYEGKYDITNIEKIPELGKYKRLREIILAPKAEDILENGCRIDLSGESNIGQLLWIPPVNPSTPLGGIFAKYRYFSKTIIFSDLKAIPFSLQKSLNDEIQCSEWKPWQDVECEVKKGLEKILKRNDWVNFVMTYLKKVGGNVLNGKNSYEVLKYCKDGCIADVMKEWSEWEDTGDFPSVLMESNAKKQEKTIPAEYQNFGEFCCCVQEDDLNAGGVTKRTCFNSPFYPFVLATTSIGAEGLDYHVYCNRMVHYTRPKNVIELEQKNGRIDRYHSLAQRRNYSIQGDRERYETLSETSGGMIPDWDAGENGIHYYFFCTDNTSDLKKLRELFDEQRDYRQRLGMPHASDTESLNLCPFLKKKQNH